MLLSLEWEGARAALPLAAVFEILEFGDAANAVVVPRARVSVRGVVMHRGYVVPVFDPRRWKGFFRSLPSGSDRYLVLVQNEDSLDGLVAERVDILRDVGPPPREGGASGIGTAFVEGEFLARRAEGAEEEAWALLSLPRLAEAMHGIP